MGVLQQAELVEKSMELTKQSSKSVLLGKYEVGRMLGQGTFAKVYLARNIKTGESVAIKAMDKAQILKVGMINQIKREICIMRMMRHSNITRLYEVMATKAKIYFVMEYVRGGELFQKVARGRRLKEDAARRYFQHLISAVDFCHGRGVYHRDLKPENLLVDERGTMKVSDFGLSALPQQLRQDGLLHTTCGTPAYVAPEVLLRKGYHAATADVWSCGVILFVLLAGYLPFHDANMVIMYNKMYKGKFVCPNWFSLPIRRLMANLLDPNPHTRITISQLLQVPWFKKGFKPAPVCEFGDADAGFDDMDAAFDECASVPKPAFLNAFDIISESVGFNLTSLFEGEDMAKQETQFMSREPASVIIAKLEEMGKLQGFKVKKKDCKVLLLASDVGRKENLAVAAEIFEVTPSVFLVQVRKVGGDSLRFVDFCKHGLRTGLHDIVWTWQDEPKS